MRLHHARLLRAKGLSAPDSFYIAAGGEPDRDARGLVLSPGWMDLHAHLRDPGALQKETLESGARSAAAGGFTHVVAMANTDPPTDSADRLAQLRRRSEKLPIKVDFVGALTEGLKGESLTDAKELKSAGAVALSDDGRHALDAGLLQVGLWRAGAAGLPVLIHPQLERLGTEPAAEVEAIREAIDALGRTADAHLHLQHVSTRESIGVIAAAKAAGLRLTAEVTPHHLALTADQLRISGPLAKVNPPLRSAADAAALRDALIDGVIDVIATDHAPHEDAVKRDERTAAYGLHGFETAVALVLSLGLPWEVVYRACVSGPRSILGQELLDEWVLIDPDQEWVVDPESFYSKGRNTPLNGRRMRGRVVMSAVGGQVVHGAEVAVG
jgi:dihydroorotase